MDSEGLDHRLGKSPAHVPFPPPVLSTVERFHSFSLKRETLDFQSCCELIGAATDVSRRRLVHFHCIFAGRRVHKEWASWS